MASIVYDGVGGGGDLFAGISFCILQRVPSRARWVQLVQANGGEIVKLERQADIVIADRIRKECPPDSIDWRFIEQSVKNGALENKEDYRAGPVTHQVREVGSQKPVKQGRTPFSAEDDRFLTKWVLRTARAGGSIKGNELYKQLEQKNPRHTFQSWRDRWIKTLSHRYEPGLSDAVVDDAEEENVDDNEEVVVVSTPRGRKAGQRLAQRTRQLDKPVSSQGSEHEAQAQWSASPAMRKSTKMSSQSPSLSPWVAKSAGGTHFTTEESRLLIDLYDDILNIDEDNEIDAWAAWSVKYPNHTPQEWRNYFVKELSPMIREKRAKKKQKTISNPEDTQISQSGSSQPIDTQPATSSTSDQIELGNTTSNTKAEILVDPTTTDEAQFQEDLTILANELGLEVQFDPTILGKQISLFSLWQVVQSDKFRGKTEVDRQKLWQQVAQELGFSDSEHVMASKELKGCYEDILEEFEEIRRECMEQPDLTESQEEELIEAQLWAPSIQQNRAVDLEEQEDDIQSNNPNERSSPALPSSSRKRAVNEPANQDSFNKRQRIDINRGPELEIPSTPEDIINKNQKQLIREPSISRSLQSEERSPLSDDPVGDNISSMNYSQPNLSVSKPTRRVTEPETQDFQFLQDDIEDDVYGVESEDETSPVQSPSLRPNGQNRSRDPTPRKMHRAGSSKYEDLDSQLQTDNELFEYIDECKARGYEYDIIRVALNACSFQGEKAVEVMESLRKGAGIPNSPGIWTAVDDKALEDKDSLEYQRILAKHGEESIFIRRRFWEREREEEA